MDHTVTAITAFNDNYIWVISAQGNNNVVLVDPGCAIASINYLKEKQLTVVAILITHHHYDHTDGIEAIIKHYPQQNINVYTPAKEHITASTHPVDDNDTIFIDALALRLTVVAVPGHTLGHIAYYNNRMLFCGDTLFSAGCGRLFEGTAEQMFQSLDKLSQLDNNTQVYCAHEYTLANLAFALTVEPNNTTSMTYYNKVKLLRANNKASIPTSIAQEKAINPFLRCEHPVIKQQAEAYLKKSLTTPLEVFAAIRAWKNHF